MGWFDLWPSLREALFATLYMVSVSAVIAVLGGLPIGVLLIATDRGGLFPAPLVNRVLSGIVNLGRSIPFIILMVALIPVTRAIVKTSLGSTAAIVPLSIAAIPFYARVAETALREVDRGLIEMAQAVGCNSWQVVAKVLIPEALPGLVRGLTITLISLIGHSAMAGAIGGGGLGDLAIRYGYQRFETDVMVATVVTLIILVQVVQGVGDRVAARLQHR
ncbi:MAG: methionine ABC transporter permease [Sphaerobacter thermophilus]|uniref:methionine ABC transporter permease n=1 Tax=Sphaerobacter thermophilus TaxID=2057 RepID=UPI00396E1752